MEQITHSGLLIIILFISIYIQGQIFDNFLPALKRVMIKIKYIQNRKIKMSRGDKSAYTDKQKRQAQHIEESERERGHSQEEAERIAWATVNKQDGGGKLT
jgi:hypothetical protein